MHIFTVTPLNTFREMFVQMRDALEDTDEVQVGEWQSQHRDTIIMHELNHVVFDMPMPSTQEELADETCARLPWAEDHFLERVSGEPLNPSPSEAWWPFAKKTDTTNADHKSEGEAFSHTYPERMWPKRANPDNIAQLKSLSNTEVNVGIRFAYGDLNDVVNQLIKHPMTRQAYLPIWFPEDTGAVGGKRVPCTLGYHFLIRNGKLDISYFMRSTDLLRHFQDDVYLAVRLAQWVTHKINQAYGPDFGDNGPEDILEVGKLVFHTANLHIFKEDLAIIDYWKKIGQTWF